MHDKPGQSTNVQRECVHGPWDGRMISDRGWFFRVMAPGWSGTYVRDGQGYRWEPDT